MTTIRLTRAIGSIALPYHRCTPATHADMARTLANFLAAAGESLRYSGDRSEYAAEYSGAAREFLESEYERLAMFADESADAEN